ncbi:hypothetical protein IFM89_039582 [Coptis chinensis]|uniref:SMP-LTD domain-containing protein n=1 Tax=Coptis chinensis TaxID=261450 RepID=A0A835GWE3_9MAGN|nr:hypothetical protein IFM89_039582 [Coptis chinensis]
MKNLVLGFLLGALAIIVAEALCVLLLWNRFLLNKKKNNISTSELDHHQQSLAFAPSKQGTVWALEPEKVPKVWSEDKVLKEQKSKKENLEVLPVRKHAKIENHSLILKDSDGSQATIKLVGCTILSVSASNLSSRKWAKRYPIKVESGSSVIYKGSRTCYLYFETSWEKESWCKALRLASCVDKERKTWYAGLSKEFHDYLTSLKAGYPSFMKPSTGFFSEPASDRAMRTDASSSKVRLFIKKLAKKASKSGLENKGGGIFSSASEERNIGENSHPFQDLYSTESTNTISTQTAANSQLSEDTVPPLQSPFTQSGSHGQIPVISDADFDVKLPIDEGTLCWNLLISRLFFDAKRNTDMKSSFQARIERTLSNMRTPSFIGGVTCTSLDLGTIPPYIHSMRVLPTDMNEVWAMEVDIEYSGGAVVDIETRLEVREAEFEKVHTSLDSGSVNDVTSDLLEGFEHFGNQLKLPGEKVDETEKRDEGDVKFDGMKKSNSWKSSYISRWKCILNSIANQVSQASIRETLVLPNCEGVCIPWMLAEKDDWAPRKIAPFVWINQETVNDSMPCEVSSCQPCDATTKLEANTSSKQGANCHIEVKRENPVPSVQQLTRELAGDLGCLSQTGSTPSCSNSSSKPLQELRTPLLITEPYETNNSRLENPDNQSASRSVSVREKQTPIGDDGNSKRVGRKAKMMDLGKKMGEKFEEQRRNLEEKSRHIVEKMRGP